MPKATAFLTTTSVLNLQLVLHPFSAQTPPSRLGPPYLGTLDSTCQT